MHLRVTLKDGREKSVLGGHPWIFSGAIANVSKEVIPGSVVGIFDKNGRFLARGYYNPDSQIAMRILTYEEDGTIDVEFFRRRFRQAFELRKRFLNFEETNAYRLVNSESDFLPGLIVDVYGDFFVVQISTLGMDVLREDIADVLFQEFKPRGVFERSDLGVREQEGMNTKPVGVLRGEEPPGKIEIKENSLKFCVDIVGGQKTGFFLDQRDNRERLRRYVEGKNVLNLFSYTGGFSVYAAKGDAAHVTSVDSSQDAIEMAKENFDLNHISVEKNEFLVGDVFDFLPKFRREGRTFDVIVVDPPSLGKKQNDLKNALKAYVSLNRRAIELLPAGGILISSSCTHFVTPEMFWDVLRGAASFAGRKLQVLEMHGHNVDHPVSIHFPEGQYLKCFFCRVL